MRTLNYKERIKKISRKRKKFVEELRKRGEKDLNLTPLIAFIADHKGIIPPPIDFKFKMESSRPDGGIYGAYDCGKNFRKLLECHPVYIDPYSSLAGGYMFHFGFLRGIEQYSPFGLDYDGLHHSADSEGVSTWNPDYDYSHLEKFQKKYKLLSGIGKSHHFSQDVTIGLKLGWKGLLNKVKIYRQKNSSNKDLYDGWENVILGTQDLVRRHVRVAKEMASKEKDIEIKNNLLKIVKINEKIIDKPPETFYEAVQWIAWFIIISVMYNGAAGIGAIDRILEPYYINDISNGTLDDEEAKFHLACLLLKDTQYYQIGGPDKNGDDITNKISFLMLEAVHDIGAPANICVRIHKKQDPKLLEKAVYYLFKDKRGIPNFISDENINRGFIKNGYSIKLARKREKTGCHWCSIPGEEFCFNDVIKINFVAIFDIALKEMIEISTDNNPNTELLWKIFIKHLEKAIEVVSDGIDFHMKYMHKVFPELVLDLMCYGLIEKGIDAHQGGMKYNNIGVDGCGLATVADSFGAIKQRIEIEKKIDWKELIYCLENDFKDSEDIRLILKNTPKFGTGNSISDKYATRITKAFAKLVKEKETKKSYKMIPGIFSWANTIALGKELDATPNGRHSGEPISHGGNPDVSNIEPGISPTAIAKAVASVQTGFGNTVPLQIEFDPSLIDNKEMVDKFIGYIKGYFNLGGTLLNVNIIDKEKILEAYKDPSKYPDLIVRVTGFSAYFIDLSEEWKKFVVDRIIKS